MLKDRLQYQKANGAAVLESIDIHVVNIKDYRTKDTSKYFLCANPLSMTNDSPLYGYMKVGSDDE